MSAWTSEATTKVRARDGFSCVAPGLDPGAGPCKGSLGERAPVPPEFGVPNGGLVTVCHGHGTGPWWDAHQREVKAYAIRQAGRNL